MTGPVAWQRLSGLRFWRVSFLYLPRCLMAFPELSAPRRSNPGSHRRSMGLSDLLHQDSGLVQLFIKRMPVIGLARKGTGYHDQVVLQGRRNDHLY